MFYIFGIDNLVLPNALPCKRACTRSTVDEQTAKTEGVDSASWILSKIQEDICSIDRNVIL